MAHVLGVSMPRSGHHFLERLLRAALADRMRYCEFHQPEDCCREIPCTRHGGFAADPGHLFLQKNHDFMLDHPILEASRFVFLIQHRQPLPRIISSYELHVSDYAKAHTPEFHEIFVAKESAYHVAFIRKWVERSGIRSIDVSYEDLTETPVETLGEVIRRLDLSESIAVAPHAAFESVSPYTDLKGTRYVPRKVENSSYFEAPLYRAAQSYIRSRLPQQDYPELVPLKAGSELFDDYFSRLADGFVAIFERDFARLVDCWRSAIETSCHNPHVFDVLELLGRMRRGGRKPVLPLRVSGAKRKLTQRFPVPPRAIDLEGMDALHSLLREEGDSRRAHDYLVASRLFGAWRNEGKALSYARAANEADAGSASSAIRCARLHLEAGRPKQAAFACRRSIDSGVRRAAIYRLNAEAQLAIGDVVSALESALAAQRMAPENPEIRDLVARCRPES